MCLTEKLVKVFLTSRHFRISAVTPPATMKPVAGHITQRNTLANVRSGTMPREARMGGAIIHETTIPNPIDRAIRGPASIQEPNEIRLTSVPMNDAAPFGHNTRDSGT